MFPAYFIIWALPQPRSHRPSLFFWRPALTWPGLFFFKPRGRWCPWCFLSGCGLLPEWPPEPAGTGEGGLLQEDLELPDLTVLGG